MPFLLVFGQQIHDNDIRQAQPPVRSVERPLGVQQRALLAGSLLKVTCSGGGGGGECKEVGRNFPFDYRSAFPFQHLSPHLIFCVLNSTFTDAQH